MDRFSFRDLKGEASTCAMVEVEDLKSRVAGQVLVKGDFGYEDARRVWNSMINRFPAMIVRCVSETDVQVAVRFAAKHQMLLSIKGGGHNVAGFATCDEGLMIDLSLMRGVSVDPETRIVKVQGGALWGDVDTATQKHALAVPGGVISETGVAGLTLGGGYSWQRRAHGMSIDSLLEATVVLASGEVVRATNDQHTDLLWALKGGGGNFGVVTEFVFRAHPLGPMVAHVETMYPLERFSEIMVKYRDFLEECPEDVTADVLVWTVPDIPEMPEHARGKPFIAMEGFYAGDAEEGMRIMQPLREFGDPLMDHSMILPYVELQKVYDALLPRTLQYYWKSAYMTGMPDEAIQFLEDWCLSRPSPRTLISIRRMGGAISKVPADATAFGDRSAPFLLSIDSIWETDEQQVQNIRWTRSFWNTMQKFSNGQMYFNFPGQIEEGTSLLRSSFGSNYSRLVDIKTKYDPQNLFRMNQNIKPREASPIGNAAAS